MSKGIVKDRIWDIKKNSIASDSKQAKNKRFL